MSVPLVDAGVAPSDEGPIPVPVVVLGDEVVTARALNPTEQWLVGQLVSAQMWQVVRAVAVSAGLVAIAVLLISLDNFLWVAVAIPAIKALLLGFRGRETSLRRWLALRKDRRLGQLLVFDSARGRSERLAGSGLLWRRNGQDAAWRMELS